jgi:hypothetical protein
MLLSQAGQMKKRIEKRKEIRNELFIFLSEENEPRSSGFGLELYIY